MNPDREIDLTEAWRSRRMPVPPRPFATGNEGQAGGVGGTFPFGVAVKGTTAYVSSDRDREVVVVDISAGKLIKRIQLDGNGLGLTLDKSQRKLYVAQDNADQIAVIDTTTNEVIETIDARAPGGLLSEGNEGHYTGAATFSSTITGRQDALRGQFRRQLDCRDPTERQWRPQGQSAHPDGLRAA
jgi:YVTN family beta-propeller protein